VSLRRGNSLNQVKHDHISSFILVLVKVGLKAALSIVSSLKTSPIVNRRLNIDYFMNIKNQVIQRHSQKDEEGMG